MKFSSQELESRLLDILKRDSRTTISDLASILGTGRTRVRKAIEGMVSDGTIRRFTIETSDEGEDIIVARVRKIDQIDQSRLIEYFEMIDGTYLTVAAYSQIHALDKAEVMDLNFAKQRRSIGFIPVGRKLTCDYCGQRINGTPLTAEMGSKILYACCPNCQNDLLKENRGKQGLPSAYGKT
jgi:hypothetical protein